MASQRGTAVPLHKLTPDAVVSAAIGVADRRGLTALTMRSLARELGVEAMSLYHHFAGKEALLDSMVDRVYGEIALPEPGSVTAIAGIPCSETAFMRSPTRAAPSSMLYSLCTCRCTKESLLVTRSPVGGRSPPD